MNGPLKLTNFAKNPLNLPKSRPSARYPLKLWGDMPVQITMAVVYPA